MRNAGYDAYIHSAAWAKRREAALMHAGYRCQVCNADNDLQVHHRTYERFGHEDIGDLTVLCNDCHALFHGKQRRRSTKAGLFGPGAIGAPRPLDQGRFLKLARGELPVYEHGCFVRTIPRKENQGQ